MIQRTFDSDNFVIVCDNCFKKSEEEFETFDDAVEGKYKAGYVSTKDKHGRWQEICRECRISEQI